MLTDGCLVHAYLSPMRRRGRVRARVAAPVEAVHAQVDTGTGIGTNRARIPPAVPPAVLQPMVVAAPPPAAAVASSTSAAPEPEVGLAHPPLVAPCGGAALVRTVSGRRRSSSRRAAHKGRTPQESASFGSTWAKLGATLSLDAKMLHAQIN